MILRKITLSLAAALVFMVQGALAQAPGGMEIPDIKQIPLTREMVQNFIKAMPSVREFSKKNNLDNPPKELGKNPMKAFLAFLKQRNLLDKANDLAKSYGFESMEQLSQVIQSTMLAYGFSKQGKSPEQMKADMQAAIDKIKNDTNVPDAQKKMFLEMISRQMTMMMKMIPPAGNIEAVKGLGDQIDKVMGK